MKFNGHELQEFAANFKKIVNRIFRDSKENGTEIYMDDIVIIQKYY